MTNSQVYKAVDNLVWFGDSWPAGSGIFDPTRLAFPHLVGSSLNICTLNYAVPGSSIPELIHQFTKWKTDNYDSNKSYILIACLTNDNRFSWKTNSNWFTIAPWTIEKDYPFNEKVKHFYKHAYHAEAVDFYNKCCIGYLKNLCNELGIPLYFLRNFKCMDEDNRLHSLLDIGLVQLLLDDLNAEWSLKLKNEIKSNSQGKEFFTNCTHPNIYGHKKIANILTEKLKLIIDHCN